MHIPQLITLDTVKEGFELLIRNMNAFVLTIWVVDSILVVTNDVDILVGCLIFHSVISIRDQVIQVEVVLIELEVHCFKFGQV